MKARKENKIYQITEMQKASYLAQGFDILDDDGNVIEHSPTATVPYSEYKELLEEHIALKEENEKVVAELNTLKVKGKKGKESEDSNPE